MSEQIELAYLQTDIDPQNHGCLKRAKSRTSSFPFGGQVLQHRYKFKVALFNPKLACLILFGDSMESLSLRVRRSLDDDHYRPSRR